MLGLGPATEHAARIDSTETARGEGSHEARMNELAAEKRRRRLKEERKRTLTVCKLASPRWHWRHGRVLSRSEQKVILVELYRLLQIPRQIGNCCGAFYLNVQQEVKVI